jgi:hypothetical protein
MSTGRELVHRVVPCVRDDSVPVFELTCVAESILAPDMAC